MTYNKLWHWLRVKDYNNIYNFLQQLISRFRVLESLQRILPYQNHRNVVLVSVTIFALCSFRKYPYSPHRGDWEFQEARRTPKAKKG